MSVLFLFTSLIPVPRMILPAGTTMLLVVLSHVGYIITQFTICRPFSRLWDNLEPGVCGNVAIFYSIVGMTDSVANVIILILPMPFVYILDIKWTKKLALASILGIGLL